jgi:hypothetical protein
MTRAAYTGRPQGRVDAMTLCPIAVVAGCRKCPAYSLCPLKGVIGDYRPEADSAPDAKQTKADATRSTKRNANRK